MSISYHNVSILYARKIERMHGMAVLDKHIVCDIHYVVYRSQAYAPQALLHPGGRRLYLYIRHNPCAVPRAKLVILDCHGGKLVYAAFALDFSYRRLFEFLTERRRRFTTHADYTLAIGSVRRKLNIKNNRIEIECLLYALTVYMRLIEYKHFVNSRPGIIGVGKSELTTAAEHAKAFYAAQRSRPYFHSVRKRRPAKRYGYLCALKHALRICNDLKGQFLAYVNRAYSELFCIGMRHY